MCICEYSYRVGDIREQKDARPRVDALPAPTSNTIHGHDAGVTSGMSSKKTMPYLQISSLLHVTARSPISSRR
jgi:hypothetical protein